MPTLLFPLYVYPAGGGRAWNPLLEAVRDNPGLRVLAVVNPSNGPGDGVSADYTAAIEALDSSGIGMAAYVYTSYGSRPVEDVEKDLDTWAELYPKVTGAFVDNVATKPGFESYYTRVVASARSRGSSFVVGNPGAPIPESYSGVFDVTVIYENAGYPATPEALDPYGWYRLHPAAFGMIVHDAGRLDADFLIRAADYVDYVCVTESYHAFPPYLRQLASQLR